MRGGDLPGQAHPGNDCLLQIEEAGQDGGGAQNIARRVGGGDRHKGDRSRKSVRADGCGRGPGNRGGIRRSIVTYRVHGRPRRRHPLGRSRTRGPLGGRYRGSLRGPPAPSVLRPWAVSTSAVSDSTGLVPGALSFSVSLGLNLDIHRSTTYLCPISSCCCLDRKGPRTTAHTDPMAGCASRWRRA